MDSYQCVALLVILQMFALSCSSSIPWDSSVTIEDMVKSRKNGHLGRIIGGASPAWRGEFPHQVSIQYSLKEDGASGLQHICSGTLVAENLVICPAHCIYHGDLLYGPWLIAGTTEENDTDCPAQAQPVERVVKHPNFTIQGSSVQNDIGFITPDRPFQLSKFVQPARVAKLGESPDNGHGSGACTTFGWGITDHENPVSRLHSAPLSFTNDKLCKAHNPDFQPFNDDQHICAYTNHLVQDTCFGDFGEPLFCTIQPEDESNDKKQSVFFGVVAYRRSPCEHFETPGIYAEVPHYMPWIQQESGIKIL